jgi:hypothetical protein
MNATDFFKHACRIPNLFVLKLEDCHIEGEIPACYNAKETPNLQYFIVTWRGRQGGLAGVLPSSLFHLPLVHLQINGGGLAGALNIPIPSQSEQTLQTLQLMRNYMSGPLPHELGQLSVLRHFYADDNRFNGSMPEAVGQLRNLQQLHLSNNELEALPTSFGQLANLSSLNLNFNR